MQRRVDIVSQRCIHTADEPHLHGEIITERPGTEAECIAAIDPLDPPWSGQRGRIQAQIGELGPTHGAKFRRDRRHAERGDGEIIEGERAQRFGPLTHALGKPQRAFLHRKAQIGAGNADIAEAHLPAQQRRQLHFRSDILRDQRGRCAIGNADGQAVDPHARGRQQPEIDRAARLHRNAGGARQRRLEIKTPLLPVDERRDRECCHEDQYDDSRQSGQTVTQGPWTPSRQRSNSTGSARS